MFKSFFATLAILLASILGGHHTSTVVTQPAATIVAASDHISPPGVAAASASSPPPVLAVADTSSPPQTELSTANAPSPVSASPSVLSGYLTQDQLTAVLAQLQSSINEQLYSSTSTYAYGGIWNAIAASQRINNLSPSANAPLTITNATISNPMITGLTTSDIPNLSGKYLSLNGGTVTGTTTITALSVGSTNTGVAPLFCWWVELQ